MVVYAIYIRSIFRGTTKPAVVSWLIWAMVDTVTGTGMFLSGTLNSQIVVASVGSWIVIALAWTRGTKEWTRVDRVCLGLGLLGCGFLWSAPAAGIVTSSVVNVIASGSTFESIWKDPTRESRFAWCMGVASCVLTVAIIPAWTVEAALQPIVFLVLNASITAVMLWRWPRPAAP